MVEWVFNGCQLQLLDWHIHLDKSLPGPLGVIGAWLHRAEMALREDIPIQHAHEETANVLHRKLEQHKVTNKPFICFRITTELLLLYILYNSKESQYIHDFVYILQEVLKNLESHRQTFQQIHRDRSVNGVPVPPEQLQDMAER